MTNTFAPPPWDWAPSGSPGGNGDFNVYITDKNGRKIAAVYGKRGEKEKTCDLLSAAPKLLEALKLAVRKLEVAARTHGNPPEIIVELIAPFELVIADAEGRP